MATITSVQSGNWSDAATWDNGVPADGDIVIVEYGHNVVVDVDMSGYATGIYLTVSGEVQGGTVATNYELWSSTNDFSAVQGNHDWRWRYKNGATYYDMPNYSGAEPWYQYTGEPNNCPVVGQKLVHAGDTYPAVLQWTAPRNMDIVIDGTFYHADTSSTRHVLVQVYQNEIQLQSDDIFHTGITVHHEISVLSGDVLYFSASKVTSYLAGTTAYHLSILGSWETTPPQLKLAGLFGTGPVTNIIVIIDDPEIVGGTSDRVANPDIVVTINNDPANIYPVNDGVSAPRGVIVKRKAHKQIEISIAGHDLTDATATAAVRDRPKHDATLLFEPSVEITGAHTLSVTITPTESALLSRDAWMDVRVVLADTITVLVVPEYLIRLAVIENITEV
jgi:hypothetical protein